jgi:hypothetical protein
VWLSGFPSNIPRGNLCIVQAVFDVLSDGLALRSAAATNAAIVLAKLCPSGSPRKACHKQTQSIQKRSERLVNPMANQIVIERER